MDHSSIYFSSSLQEKVYGDSASEVSEQSMRTGTQTDTQTHTLQKLLRIRSAISKATIIKLVKANIRALLHSQPVIGIHDLSVWRVRSYTESRSQDAGQKKDREKPELWV